jgi:glutaconate CoA-transferase, subunit B
MTETAVTGAQAAPSWTADEMMSIAAARALRDGQTCFVGIGLPSAAANLARRLHAPGLALIYESGTLDTRPGELPLSIGDGILAETALTIVSVPEVFNYWLQPGRIDVGFLSGAQIDRLGNINTTVIGEYDEPVVRLPGSGGAPEIAACCREVIVVMRHRQRAFVEQVDFVTSVGHGSGRGDRELLGLRGAGPVRVISDLGVLEPDPETAELVLTALHPGVTIEQVRAETGWPLQVAPALVITPPPRTEELETLRGMRTVGPRSPSEPTPS